MQRIASLDSLRGVAAVVVVVDHVLRTRGRGTGIAHRAVMLFFVLSGFVLAQPWLSGTPPSWGAFVGQRTFRLWPPVLVAVAAAVLVFVTAGPSDWQDGWQGRLNAEIVAQCVALIGSRGGCREHAPPLWSLSIEARISVIFPALVLVRLRTPAAMLGCAIVLGLMGDALFLRDMGRVGPMSGGTVVQNINATIHYAVLFVFGIVLGARFDRARRWAARFHPVFLCCLAAPLLAIPSDVAEGAGAALLIVLAPDISVLRWAPLRWAGRVSYSLYLIHWPILTLGLHVFGVPLPWFSAAAVAAASGLAAEIMYRLVEAPSTSLGRLIAWNSATRQQIEASRR